MNKSLIKTLCIAVPLTLGAVSCSKNDDNNTDTDAVALQNTILSDASVIVCKASYQDMFDKATALQTSVTTLIATPTDANLADSRTKWKAMRETWEQTEAWLFGPVSENSIDPRIDTWPVDFNALNTIINGTDELNDAYIEGLDDALRGFHPIEFLLWGENGTKIASQFNDRQKQYLAALTTNLVKLTTEVRNSWTTDGYDKTFAAGGKASLIQLVDGMSGICEEVGNGKMKEPFDAQDPSLEESPFAQNSIIDFTNNIKGIMDMYQGKFLTDGKGLEDFVRTKNLSLDADIKSKHAAAIAALGQITVPFGRAITEQPAAVQNAMTKINTLFAVLDGDLKTFVQTNAK